jgi:RNA polymerase sigma-70 factor (ECF subfamily)
MYEFLRASNPWAKDPLTHMASRKQCDFDTLVRSHWRRLYQIAFCLCGNEEDANDLISISLIDAFRSFAVYRGTGFERWLGVILRQNHYDILRYQKARPYQSLSDTGQYSDENADPASLILRHHFSEEWETAIRSLPSEFRKAVLLRDVEECEYSEIATILGISLGTVRSRIHRGRATLRQLLLTVNRPTYSQNRTPHH